MNKKFVSAKLAVKFAAALFALNLLLPLAVARGQTASPRRGLQIRLEELAGGQFDAADAIQARIDALPPVSGVPDGKNRIGGVVQIPSGTFAISRPIRLPSAVALVGQGASTILRCTAPADSAAILIVSPFTHGSNIGARIEKLSIYTESARGIAIDTSIRGACEDLVLRDLYLNTGNIALDLWPTNTKEPLYAPELTNIRVIEPGAQAIRIRARIGSIRSFKINNLPRKKFNRPEDAMCVFDGYGTIDDSWFEGDFGGMLAIVSGWWTLHGNWFEQDATAPCAMFVDGMFTLDQLFFFHNKAQLILKAADVRVTQNLEYRKEPDALWIDDKSKLFVRNEEIKGIKPPGELPSIKVPTTQAAR